MWFCRFQSTFEFHRNNRHTVAVKYPIQQLSLWTFLRRCVCVSVCVCHEAAGLLVNSASLLSRLLETLASMLSVALNKCVQRGFCCIQFINFFLLKLCVRYQQFGTPVRANHFPSWRATVQTEGSHFTGPLFLHSVDFAGVHHVTWSLARSNVPKSWLVMSSLAVFTNQTEVLSHLPSDTEARRWANRFGGGEQKPRRCPRSIWCHHRCAVDAVDVEERLAARRFCAHLELRSRSKRCFVTTPLSTWCQVSSVVVFVFVFMGGIWQHLSFVGKLKTTL